MPTSKKKKHGARKPHKPPVYQPEHTLGLSDSLRSALIAKLDLKELIALEKQLRMVVEEEKREATINTHKTTWAVVLRVLNDRFGFETEDKRRLYDESMDYLQDIRDKRITRQEMLDTLENEDGIRLTWEDEDAEE